MANKNCPSQKSNYSVDLMDALLWQTQQQTAASGR